jgi:ribosomal protein S12 methylthiotransferase accessory factor YcaO
VAALLAPQELDGGLRHVELTLGAGAALRPEGAIIRAILEAVRSRMTIIAGARDDLLPSLLFAMPVTRRRHWLQRSASFQPAVQQISLLLILVMIGYR